MKKTKNNMIGMFDFDLYSQNNIFTLLKHPF